MPHTCKFDNEFILIAGPTASGKTSFALELAKDAPTIIINADSMQVYSDLWVVTARPTADEESGCPHFLFGHVDGASPYSVAQWLGDVEKILEAEGKETRVVFVGGTGLYFKALVEGLSAIPEIDPEIREKWRAVARAEPESLHQELLQRDAETANRLGPSDTQRLARALEVIESTGRSITDWQSGCGDGLLAGADNMRKIVLMPERPAIHDRINRRFEEMVEHGALDEVRALLGRKLDPGLPVMKAIGVRELGAYLDGEMSLAEAMEKAKAATRQYAKRQTTWFRNSLDDSWEFLPR